jgi:hypothetical protein
VTAWQVSIMKNISLYLRVKISGLSWENNERGRPLLLPHLFESVGNVECADLFVVLELEELVTSVSGHVNEYVGPIIGQEPFRPGYGRVNST